MAAPSSAPAPAAAPPTYAQLHEQQCIACPAMTDLRPAGHRRIDGLSWAVVACPEHAGEAS
jgi:hypothetical protein